jgi:hypothetical protein
LEKGWLLYERAKTQHTEGENAHQNSGEKTNQTEDQKTVHQDRGEKNDQPKDQKIAQPKSPTYKQAHNEKATPSQIQNTEARPDCAAPRSAPKRNQTETSGQRSREESTDSGRSRLA